MRSTNVCLTVIRHLSIISSCYITFFRIERLGKFTNRNKAFPIVGSFCSIKNTITNIGRLVFTLGIGYQHNITNIAFIVSHHQVHWYRFVALTSTLINILKRFLNSMTLSYVSKER
jgi:hypothetical protein